MNSRKSEPSAAFAALLGRTYPEGVVELRDPNASYFWRVEPRLRRRLQEIEGAGVLYQRSWNGEEESGLVTPAKIQSDDGESEFPLASEARTASYHLYFLGLDNPDYTYVCEGEPLGGADELGVGETQDDESEETVPMEECDGKGWIGCCVAVSLVAPVALLVLSTFEVYGPSDYTIPDIEPHYFSLDGKPLEMEAHFQETMGPEATRAAVSVREQAAAALRACRIRVLSEPQASQPAVGLRAGEHVFISGKVKARKLTVRDAFFFRGP